MGIFSRIGEIVNANISSMLEKAENPEKMVRLMIHEMEDTLTEVKSSAAELIADRIRTDRKLKTFKANRQEWQDRAELAVVKDRDDLARIALERKMAYEQRIVETQESLRQVEAMVKQYQGDITRLESQLQRAYRRQRELNLKHKRAEHSRKVEDKIYQINRSSAFLKFEEYAERIDRLEAEGEVDRFREPENQLERQFQELEHEGDIEAELNNLKKNKNKPDQ